MNGERHANVPELAGPVPLWIAGQELTTTTTFDVISPNDAKNLWSSSSASPKEAVQAIEAAQRAFKTWRKSKPAEIRTVLLKAADVVEGRREELSEYRESTEHAFLIEEIQETGAPRAFVDFTVGVIIDMFRDVAGRAGSILGAIPPTSSHGQSAFVFKEPYGVNFAIAPWNAPYVLGVRSFLYALAGGNTAILKGSELCPRTFWALGSVMKQAGLPDGVLSVIYHQTSDAAAVANTIIEHPFVKKVNFTGSTITGSIIAAKAGKELKPVLMELGGKASALVCEDADLEKAAMGVAMGSFFHAGQICMATERILVNRKVLEPFAKALKAASEKVYAPDADAPVLVSTAGVDKNLKLLNDATSKGAKVLYGDVKPEQQSSYRLRPVIISDVKKEMDIFYQESFGPTVSLIAVDSDEEAIEIANDTEYGLSGAVFTESLGRGLKIAKEIDSGAIHINSMSVHDESLLPHGGVKKSGWGRFNAQWGVEEFLKLKTVTYME